MTMKIIKALITIISILHSKIYVFLFCSGVMKLEAAKFRPREVVKHVLQTAAASLQKILTLEGDIADDVPIEVRFS